MSFWYHGTNKKTADIILKKGFKFGTYFANHLETALVQGGPYVFWIWFDKDPTKYWEYISAKNIHKNKIALFRKYNIRRLYDNEAILNKIRQHAIREHYGKTYIGGCKYCKGHGELTTRKHDEPRNRKLKRVICPKCRGFGCFVKGRN